MVHFTSNAVFLFTTGALLPVKTTSSLPEQQQEQHEQPPFVTEPRHPVGDSTRNPELKNKQQLQNPSLQSIPDDGRTTYDMSPSPSRKNKQHHKIVLNAKRYLKNHVVAHDETTKRECNPFSADVGILDCSRPHEFCQESLESKLGGFCVDDKSRNMQQHHHQKDYVKADIHKGAFSDTINAPFRSMGEYICEPSFSAPYGQCDCSAFNTFDSTGSIMCTIIDNYCPYECLIPTCYSKTFQYRSRSDGGFETTICWDFNTPSNQNFCVTYTQPKSEISYVGYGGPCQIELDGQVCTSCHKDPNDGYCVIFNCTDIGAGYNHDCSNYNNYYDPYNTNVIIGPEPPLMTQCRYAAPILGECIICPEGSRMTNETSKRDIIFPFIGNLTCEYLNDFADTGRLYGTACRYVQDAAERDCCVMD